MAKSMKSGDVERQNRKRVSHGLLQSRINRLAFEGEDGEGALVDSSERLLLHEAFKRFYPERELPRRQTAFAG